MKYAKPWLLVEDQVDRLKARGIAIGEPESAATLLSEVGYYRLTGYLYPFREVVTTRDPDDGERVVITDGYRSGTRLDDAARLLDFDRELRLLVIDGVERIEVALRTQIAHVLGRFSAFAHEDTASFTDVFTTSTGPEPSPHERWLTRVHDRQAASDEAFVRHFRERYDGRMPIWALTEILELGQVSRLYGGLRNDVATEIAAAFGVPTKRLMASWISSVNYVRNVAAHHARLFNRKLVVAPKRPRPAAVPLMAHLTERTPSKQFGVYSTLAVMAYLLRSVPSGSDWASRTAALLGRFPTAGPVDIGSMGAVAEWLTEPLWCRTGDSRHG